MNSDHLDITIHPQSGLGVHKAMLFSDQDLLVHFEQTIEKTLNTFKESELIDKSYGFMFFLMSTMFLILSIIMSTEDLKDPAKAAMIESLLPSILMEAGLFLVPSLLTMVGISMFNRGKRKKIEDFEKEFVKKCNLSEISQAIESKNWIADCLAHVSGLPQGALRPLSNQELQDLDEKVTQSGSQEALNIWRKFLSSKGAIRAFNAEVIEEIMAEDQKNIADCQQDIRQSLIQKHQDSQGVLIITDASAEPSNSELIPALIDTQKRSAWDDGMFGKKSPS